MSIKSDRNYRFNSRTCKDEELLAYEKKERRRLAYALSMRELELEAEYEQKERERKERGYCKCGMALPKFRPARCMCGIINN